jgi:DNA-3-methyladenine glycosylase I
MKKRCAWVKDKSPLYIAYHDKEWGEPVKKDQKLFEFLILEGAQAGLSWETVLNKRENYRLLFKGFDPLKISKMTDKQLEKILLNPGIIRNRLKVFSVRQNAHAYFQIQEEFGSFSKYIWSFVGGKTKINKWKRHQDIPSKTVESDAMSKDLKKRDFKFIGSTICYAFMQAAGLVQDHTIDCFRYKK